MSKGHSEAVSERVADVLAGRILSGALPPGMRIKQDELAAELNISRIPVRDALRILEARGLVSMRANTGARVISLDEADLAAAFDICERLEPLLLASSLARFTQEDVFALKALLDAPCEDIGAEAMVQRARAFHWLAYSRHSSALLAGMVERIWDALQSYVLAAWARMSEADALGAREEHVNEHRVLYEAIARGELETAQAVLILHIRRIRMFVLGSARRVEQIGEA
ncbi:GntR family transcriptional regulator [Novosphingobium profundi]|uniref:GntR family transcriptional regulator n=1 Tax=Novosphingobium profundi TaxID=1774954 RepID=UPI001BDB4456|nr:GntR family transcriptional regulator [Novosphingobium profundi]MBT0667157.1 GntR family transcriptional regulator [Novosphingobium profundi]